MKLKEKDKLGSRIRCLDLSLLIKQDSTILEKLVNLKEVKVPKDPTIVPCGRREPDELIFNKNIAVDFMSKLFESNKGGFSDYADFKSKIENWWLVHTNNVNTPNWDLACIAEIHNQAGLILVEAKAHKAELSRQVKSYDQKNPRSRDNHYKIINAIDEANKGLSELSKLKFNLSDKSPYQLTNRFAWSWFLAKHGIPVVLAYLGFINAEEIDGKLFSSHADVVNTVRAHCKDDKDNTVYVPDQSWEQGPLFDDGYATMYSVIRSMELSIGQATVFSINGIDIQ